MIDIDISYGTDASKWGLTDFYEESEMKLKEALESGEDFTTGWFGCKKEIRYAKYERCGDEFTISVCCHMDDLWEEDDLIYDALWSACKVEEELPQEIIDSIRDAAIDCGIDDHAELWQIIPSGEATFEKIVEITDSLEQRAEEENDIMFKDLCEKVKGHYEYWKETQNDRL